MRWLQRLLERVVPSDDGGVSGNVRQRTPDRETPKSHQMVEAEHGSASGLMVMVEADTAGSSTSGADSGPGHGHPRPSRLRATCKRLISVRSEALPVQPPAPPPALIGAGAAAVVRRLRMSVEDVDRAESSRSGDSYSTASVVSTTGLMVIRSASNRLADACADALDLKVSRCQRALLLLPVFANLLTHEEHTVCLWALDAARHRALEHEHQLQAVSAAGGGVRMALSLVREREPTPPSELVVRAFCGDRSGGGSGTGVWPMSTLGFAVDAAASTVAAATATKDSRPVILYLPFPVAILAILSALARFQCAVWQRWARHRGAAATIRARIDSGSSDAAITVDVYQGMPIVAVLRPQKRVLATHSRVNRDNELLEDVADVLLEFNTAMRT